LTNRFDDLSIVAAIIEFSSALKIRKEKGVSLVGHSEIPAPAKHQMRDLIANRLRFEKRQVSTQQLQARAIVDLSNLGLIDNEEGDVEKNDYHSISGGRRIFEFGVSWLDENKDFFIVTASVNPWCTSNWRAITYRVLRCGPQPYEPSVLLSRKQTIYLGAEDPP
jgi:hypothetical protein